MKLECPNNCSTKCSSSMRPHFRKDGFYFRKSDSRKIQRYCCLLCGKNFSKATFSPCYRQKKRRVNDILFKLLSSGVSMRRAAILLNIHRNTVKKKMDFLAEKAEIKHHQFLLKLENQPVEHLQIDDLITTEHTKLKPLSISVAVDAKRRFILSAEVSTIPSFGLLSEKSKRKYGNRPNEHKAGLSKLFFKIKNVINKKAIIKSDEHQNYPEFIRRFFPDSTYQRYKGSRGAIVGQGELKKIKRDPLFMINHTCAMLRANINRLFRRTWCTTKDPNMLQKHLNIYIDFHNTVLLKGS